MTVNAALYADDTGQRRSAAVTVAVYAVVLGALLTGLYWYEIRRLIYVWSTQGNWSHGFVVPLVSLYFVWLRRDVLLRTTPRTSWFGLVILAGSLAMYLASAFVLRMNYPQAVSLVGVIAGLVLFLGGWGVLRHVWLAVVYLLFAIPLPGDIYVSMTMPLRKLAAQVVAGVLSFLPGVVAQAQGVIVEMDYAGQTRALEVADACSGMRVLMGLCALGVAFAFLIDRPPWQRIVLVLLCVPIAVFTNLVRVATTGVFWLLGWEGLAEGTGHTVWGIVMYALALGLFFGVGWILDHLFVEEPEPLPTASEGQEA